jgi:hypothetical protein
MWIQAFGSSTSDVDAFATQVRLVNFEYCSPVVVGAVDR